MLRKEKKSSCEVTREDLVSLFPLSCSMCDTQLDDPQNSPTFSYENLY